MGIGHDRPRASTDWAISMTGMTDSLRWRSDEDDLALAGVEVEGGHAFDPVDQRIQISGFEMEQVHRQAARLDVDATDVLRLAERLGPRRLARRRQRIDGDPPGRAGLRCEAVIV